VRLQGRASERNRDAAANAQRCEPVSEGETDDGKPELAAGAFDAERALLACREDRTDLGHGNSDPEAAAANVDERLRAVGL
jgi:hypothetical protein